MKMKFIEKLDKDITDWNATTFTGIKVIIINPKTFVKYAEYFTFGGNGETNYIKYFEISVFTSDMVREENFELF